MAPTEQSEASILETIQSLIVAFVMAMTFRGFVLEGFVIPTGSMAPTLMGQHTLWTSPETGATFRIDAASLRSFSADTEIPIPDPMLGPDSRVTAATAAEMASQVRMGDRILVLKSMYPFREPSRWDVVVFKTPTSPKGDKENYIKRLVGLPNEKTLLADGDVFAGPAETGGDRLDDLVVQRKPEHIQRAVWQPVYDSDYIPLRSLKGTSWEQSPWSGDDWTTAGVRAFTTDSDDRTELTWSHDRLPITDWNAYDITQYRLYDLENNPGITPVPVSDIRIAAAIEPQATGLETTFELQTREHVFAFTLTADEARVSYWPIGRPDAVVDEKTAPFAWRVGAATPVEFWHVDQSMQLFVDGDRILNLEYDWRPIERYENASGGAFENIGPYDIPNVGRPPQLVWRFEGAPTTLRRVRVDRDLFYRAVSLPNQRAPGFATHPDTVAVLGPDHFMMLGDNSPASSDSRVWGASDPLVVTQIDPAPFVVHRKLLLGKAWSVYFPSPYRLGNTKYRIVPDFGRLRLIR